MPSRLISSCGSTIVLTTPPGFVAELPEMPLRTLLKALVAPFLAEPALTAPYFGGATPLREDAR